MSIHECLYEITDPNETTELSRVFPFTIGSLTYSLNGLITINRFLRNNTIQAAYDSNMRNTSYARYTQPTGFNRRTGLPWPSEIRAGFDSFGAGITGESRRGVLLHECIHAMQDKLGLLSMRVDTAEAAAYIAQCLFYRARRIERRHYEGLVAAAWDATEQIRNDRDNRRVTNIDSLLSAIQNDPLYQNEASVTGRYNGIPRPPDEQQRPQPSRGCTCSASGFSNRSGYTRLSRILGI